MLDFTIFSDIVSAHSEALYIIMLTSPLSYKPPGYKPLDVNPSEYKPLRISAAQDISSPGYKPPPDIAAQDTTPTPYISRRDTDKPTGYKPPGYKPLGHKPPGYTPPGYKLSGAYIRGLISWEAYIYWGTYILVSKAHPKPHTSHICEPMLFKKGGLLCF